MNTATFSQPAPAAHRSECALMAACGTEIQRGDLVVSIWIGGRESGVMLHAECARMAGRAE